MSESTKTRTAVTRRAFLGTGGKGLVAAGVVGGLRLGLGAGTARAANPIVLTVVVPEHWKVTEGIAKKNPATVPPRRLWYFERIMQWEREHPDIKLEHQSVNWEQIAPRFIAASLAGDPPDILTVDGNELPALVNGGFLYPLDDFKYDEWSDFNKDVVAYCTINGHIYAMSFYLGIWLYFANLKLLKAAGITQLARTWPELISQAKRLTKDTKGLGHPDQWGFGVSLSQVGIEEGPGALASIVWSQGGHVADATGRALIATPEMEKSVQLAVDLVTKEKVMSTEVLSTRAGDQVDLMNAERWATGILHSSYYVPVAAKLGKTNVGLGPLPVFPGGTPYGAVEVFLAAISTKAGKDPTKREAAFELIKFFGADETLWAAAKYQFGMPVRKSALKNPVYEQDPAMKFLAQYTVDHGRPLPHIKDVRFFFDALMGSVASAVLGRMTPRNALRDAQQKYDERIKRA